MYMKYMLIYVDKLILTYEHVNKLQIFESFAKNMDTIIHDDKLQRILNLISNFNAIINPISVLQVTFDVILRRF